MKTTIDLPDVLLRRAKRTALDRRVTLRELIERGLERELDHPSPPPCSPFEQLLSLDNSIWQNVNPDAYVEEQRKGWE